MNFDPDSPPPLPTLGDDRRPRPGEKEVADGKVMAIVSYVANFVHVPFFVIPLLMKDNAFALYHAKQCLTLWCVAIVGWACFSAFALIGTICTFGLGLWCIVPLGVGLWLCAMVVNLIGLIAAIDGRCSPVPIVGGKGERWFAGIRVTPSGTP